MVFPKPLGDFNIALLSPFVAAAQKKNNCSGINRVINSVTGAVVYFQLHDTFADIADCTKVACFHPCQAGADSYRRYLVTQALQPFSEWLVPVFISVIRYSVWFCLY